MLNRDYKEILQYLNEEKAEFLIVGAYAMASHGFPRSTGDFDIWVNPTPANASRVYRALAAFGAPLQDVTPADFEEQGIIYQIGVEPCRIDIITMISGGISFSEAAKRAVKADFDGEPMAVLSIDDLITNKLATGRPKDVEDVRLLKKNHS